MENTMENTSVDWQQNSGESLDIGFISLHGLKVHPCF